MTEDPDAALVDELTSIIERVSELMELGTRGLDDNPGVEELTGRLRRMGKNGEADELGQLFARAEELKSYLRNPVP